MQQQHLQQSHQTPSIQRQGATPIGGGGSWNTSRQNEGIGRTNELSRMMTLLGLLHRRPPPARHPLIAPLHRMTDQHTNQARRHSYTPPSPLQPSSLAYVSPSPRSIGSSPRPFAAAALAAASDGRHTELQLIHTFRDWVMRGLVVCLLLSLLTLMLLQSEVLRTLKGAAGGISQSAQRNAPACSTSCRCLHGST